jgi:hypothetical protein
MPQSTGQLVSAAPPSNPHTEVALRILRRLLANFRGSAAVRLCNDIIHTIGGAVPAFTLVVRDPVVLRRLVLRRSPLLLSDAYFAGCSTSKATDTRRAGARDRTVAPRYRLRRRNTPPQ